jgi:Tfp pilus assembly protein PilF
LSPEETFPKARIAVRKALELDDTLSEAHTTQAALLEFADWDWPGTEREYKRALELNPGYATAHHWYGEFLSAMGRFDEGLAEFRLAQRLDPLSPRTNANVGWAYYVGGRYGEAIAELQKAIELNPDHARTYELLNSVHSKMGLHDRAIAEARIAFERHAAQGALNLARTLALAGKHPEARKLLAVSLVSKNGYVSRVFVAMTYVALGETENALAWLEKGYAERDSFMVYILVEPSLDPLRDVPRFKDLLRRMALTN